MTNRKNGVSSKPTPRKKTRKTGRPSKLTDEVEKDFLIALNQGSYIETACNFAGIARDTYYGWQERARKAREKSGKLTAIEQRLVDFSDKVKKVMASTEMRDLERIKSAAESQWQAAAWRLERRYPERWGRTRHEISGPDGGPISVSSWAELALAAKKIDDD